MWLSDLLEFPRYSPNAAIDLLCFDQHDPHDQHAFTLMVVSAGLAESKRLPNYKKSTRGRYEELLSQSILTEFGSMRLDAIDGGSVRRFLARELERGVQVRAQYDFIFTLLQSAVDLGELKAMPTNLPPRPKQSKKLPDCPSIAEIDALMTVATGWVRGACALGI